MENKLFEEFWKFAYERHEVFINKFTGKLPPYTSDVILQSYKFCNAYRILDRVSQYLLQSVIYNGKNYSSENMIFRIIFFKLFNLPSTWEYLIQNIGDITLENFDIAVISKLLTSRQKVEPIYNSAYIACASKAFGFDKKHDNHLHLLYKMFISDKMQNKILNCRNMKEAFEILVSYPLIGNFMAYQLITDLNYSDVVNFTESEFTVVGPGSKRGIEKIFKTFTSYEDIILYAYNNQCDEFKKQNLNFKYIGDRKLQLIDIQNLFCEFDKYCRQKHPQLKSNRTKIKKKYTETSNKINYIFPPKWNIGISFITK